MKSQSEVNELSNNNNNKKVNEDDIILERDIFKASKMAQHVKALTTTPDNLIQYRELVVEEIGFSKIYTCALPHK